MGDIHGYGVATREGKTVGHVAGESDVAVVVECGTWPRKLKQGVLVDDEAVASWRGLD